MSTMSTQRCGANCSGTRTMQPRAALNTLQTTLLRKACPTSSDTFVCGKLNQSALARGTAIRASGRDVERQAQNAARKVEGISNEAQDRAPQKVQDGKDTAAQAGRKIEGVSEEAQEQAPQKAQEGKETAARAGQEAKGQYEDPTQRSKFVAEFSAMALFTFLTSTASAAAAAQASNATQALLWRMGAFSVIFPLIIYVFAPISKAHFNPMVTISLVLAGQQTISEGLNYIISQLLGAILGAALALWSLPGSQQNGGALAAAAVPAGVSVAQAFLGELIGGAIFLYVLLAAIVDPRGWGKLGPLSLGLAVPLLMWTVGPVSGLSINPARAFGLSVVLGSWKNHWVYWVAPILGGGLAGKIYATFFLPTAKEA